MWFQHCSCCSVARGFNTALAVNPRGLTSVLQPLDVSQNHPFNCRVRDQWTRWMSSGAAELTAVGNSKRPSLSTAATWVKTAWDSLEDCMIQKSFKKCSISNSFDGPKDDILWTDVREDTHDADEDDTYNDRTYRRTSFFWGWRFLRFWTMKLTFITFAVKINILWLIDRAGSSQVKRSIDLQLICELPLILGIWLKFLLRLICGCG